jgi:hypothetical protein
VTAQPLSGIDHVLIAVDDLERARMGWARLGFTLTPRGRHLQQGTGNYCIMFERDYIELLGVVDPAQGTGGLDAFLRQGEGLRGVAFATDAGDAITEALRRRGLHPAPPRDLSRQLELPEGTVLPRFKLVSLPDEQTPSLSSFICQHLTPELVRRPGWLAHPNAVTGITGVAVMVAETAPLREPYERLFGTAVTMTDDVLTLHVGAHRLIFATPDDIAALYPEADVLLDRALPAIAVLSLRSRDLARTADHLTQWHVAYEQAADGALVVPPEEASGALLVIGRG